MSNAKKKAASKNAYRRAKKKEQRIEGSPPNAANAVTDIEHPGADANSSDEPPATSTDVINIEDISMDDPLYEQFKNVFEKYVDVGQPEEAPKDEFKAEVYFDDDDIPDEEDEQPKFSKKQLKKMRTPTVAELKSKTDKPELVDWQDVSASDPELLLMIKGSKNVIPVPKHWELKREYLSSKRGIEKPPFQLPKFIQETGIAEMRDAVLEKQADMTMRQKQRERVQGKLGKMDIDYRKLYDAFFRRQTKPELTKYGEVYYEGKEYETNTMDLRPGELTDDLKEALSMPSHIHPPPWLLAMQRVGPSPAYPTLRVPGVNAPIPPGASWGMVAGGWGKAPVNEQGQPLWGGDLYGMGVLNAKQKQAHEGEPIERGYWGSLRQEGQSEDEESDDEDEDEDEEDEEGEDEDADMAGVQTSMPNTSGPADGGLESIAGEFTLRKQRKGIETEDPEGAPRSAYTVLPEKNIAATGFFGGEHAYDLDAAQRDSLGAAQRKRKAGDVEMSVDVDQLGEDGRLDRDALEKEYESRQRAEAQGQWQSIDQDDLANMIAAESRKRVKREDERKPRR